MARKERIEGTGKEKYLFKPGKDGSLISLNPPKPSNFIEEMLKRNVKPISKVIMPPPGTPQQFADGGIVQPEEDDKLMAWLDQENVPRGTSVVSPTPETPHSPDLAPTNRGAAEETISKSNVDERVADSSPGHDPREMQQWIQGQEKQLDKFGPKRDQELADYLIKQQGSLGNRLARGGASLGDAIMSVSGHGSPGFLNSLENRQAGQENIALNALKSGREANKDIMAAKERYAGMDSSSPLGASMTAPMAAFFERVGVPKAEIPRLLANPAAARAVIEPFASVMTNEDKMKMDLLLKQLEMGQQNKRFEADVADKAAQDELDKTRLAVDASGKLQNRGILQKVRDVVSESPETAKLREIAGTGTDKVIEHPAAQEALEWAKSHMNDPRAKKILDRLGK